MSEDFFQKLDEALTSVGSDKYWERKIGGHIVWFSPVPFSSQHKINELLSNESLGPNIIGEVKRTTLSHAIIGFDGFDLREFRNDTPNFPLYDNREKKHVKVALHKYLYAKIGDWGTEWIDSSFEVFSDILESIRKENLKDIVFENIKSEKEELAELEEKVRELRRSLGMPALVEFNYDDDKPVAKKEHEEEEVKFNPFKKVLSQVFEGDGPLNIPNPVVPNKVPNPVVPNPVNPVNIEAKDTSISNPHVVASQDVIESRSEINKSNIEIDRVDQNINPRFRKPGVVR